MNRAKRCTEKEEGVAAIEYVLIAAIIALAIIASLELLGATFLE